MLRSPLGALIDRIRFLLQCYYRECFNGCCTVRLRTKGASGNISIFIKGPERNIVDNYTNPIPASEVMLRLWLLKSLSGKFYR